MRRAIAIGLMCFLSSAVVAGRGEAGVHCGLGEHIVKVLHPSGGGRSHAGASRVTACRSGISCMRTV